MLITFSQRADPRRAPLVGLTALLAAFGCSPPQPREPGVVPVTLATPAADAPAAVPQVEREILRRGDTLDAMLARLGIAPDGRAGIVSALRDHIDPRRLRPGVGAALLGDAATSDGRVSLRYERDSYLRLERNGPGWSVRRVEVPLRIGVEIDGGVIRDSLHRALAGLGRGTELAIAVSEIFQWEIDLLVDPRPGDHVRVVYEVLRLGKLPADLPPFGDSPLEAGATLGLGRVLAASYEGSRVRSDAFWIHEADGSGDYYDAGGEPLRKTFLRSPLNYRRISSGFSRARRNPVTRKVIPHHGVDFAAPAGTPVVATADGRVVFAGWRGPLGRCVELRHPGGFRTLYGHLSRIAKGMRVGARIEQGQLIGNVGATGRATGPHLHYAMKSDGRAVNPLNFRNPPLEPLAPRDRPALDRSMARWLPVLEKVRLVSG